MPPFMMGAPFTASAAIAVAAGSLEGLNWRLPGSPHDNIAWACAASTSSSAVMGGAPGASYDVTLRFRGVVERKTYTGGTNDGAQWQVGGSPTPSGVPPLDPTNVYKLTISSPAQTFYINRGTSGTACLAIDFTKTIQIDQGATVTLEANSGGDSFELTHDSTAAAPYATISVAGVTSPAQPYVGQWVNMDVTLVVPH